MSGLRMVIEVDRRQLQRSAACFTRTLCRSIAVDLKILKHGTNHPVQLHCRIWSYNSIDCTHPEAGFLILPFVDSPTEA